MRLKRSEIKKARVEIIPMIDTMFFLLAFFMIASLALTTMKGIPVSLPTSSTSTERSVVKTVVTVTSNDRYYLDKDPVHFNDIRPMLSSRLKENPGMVIIINCDKEQNWGRGIAVMDEARKAGAEILSIATEPETEKG